MHACCDTSVLPPRASTEMLRLRRILRQLEHRRQSISRYLLTKRSFLSPIRRLPPELLEMVFSFAVLSGKEDASFFSKSASAVRLAHVCSHWRAITLDMSKLWATILLFSRPQQVDTSIDQLKFYAARAKALPLTIRCCNWPSLSLLLKLIPMSHRWRDITLRVENQFIDEKLGIVRQKIPLLESLSIWNAGERDGADTNNVFEDAPSLRRIILIAHYGHVWPFSWILPWEQITSLMLKPISLSVFSECIRNCPHLLYLNAVVQPRTAQVVQPMAELRSSLRKLVLRGLRCEETVLAHSFPNMVSLSIEMQRPSPEFLAFLARSSHLEMLALSSSSSAPTEILIALLLATPSLRLVHFKDQHTVMVTPRFYTPLVPPGPDDPFLPVEPQSLAELGVEGCTAFNDAVLLAFIQARGPSFDPHGIEKARLQVEGTPFDPEAELDYLLLDPTHTSHR
ncbi:hypothetical protein FB451DRAFT_1236897 [Mycena latifolia]|nr:hypothetical protein FB451DRAFT_1236897 [Mycena latifolia]